MFTSKQVCAHALMAISLVFPVPGAILSAAALLLALSVSEAGAITFTTLDDPLGVSTIVTGVSGVNVVGYYLDAVGAHGFEYNGTSFTTIDYPLEGTAAAPQGTYLYGISGNDIVGYYQNSVGQTQSFVYDGSTFTPINFPGGTNTEAYGISGNNVVGTYSNVVGVHSNLNGFQFNGSTYSTLNGPQGTTGIGAYGVSGNTVVGGYATGPGVANGFVYDGSTFTTLSDPAGPTFTEARAISGSDIAGVYLDGGSLVHGFLYDGLAYTTIDDPLGNQTILYGISGDTIVGTYFTNSTTPYHGFIATIPEPSTLILAALGGMVLLTCRRWA